MNQRPLTWPNPHIQTPDPLPPVRSEPLLASLSALIEAWRTERDFLATGTGSDLTAARIYDECAMQAMELVKANMVLTDKRGGQ